jgi:hypothetical protein
MNKIKKLKLLLPAFAVVIALMASAFTYSPKHATIVTSYFANESHSTSSLSIGASVPTGYTRVTPTVISLGLNSYLNAHCKSPITEVCLAAAQGNAGDPQADFTVTAVDNGTFQ